ncbi:MAG: hypothetical protein J6A29_03065 [Clostridia bacterium]|nr:hypothetical protein [Clostridia bacterium]
MTIIYVKECESNEELIINSKIPKFINKIVIKIKKKFNIITTKQILNNYIYIIPNKENKNVKNRLEKKLSKESKDIQIVLSKKIKSLKLQLNKVKIIDGKRVQKYAIEEILKYILNLSQNQKLQFQDIYILQKEHNFETIYMIEHLKDKVKTINIITNAIGKYKKLEDNLYNEGYLITVSNNKKKSLKKAKIIINMDFSKEEISSYIINRNSIIINFTNERIDNLRGFEGMIINSIKIDMKEGIKQYFKENNLYYKFDNVELYESICETGNFEKQTQNIKENEIRVIELIGNNGKISEKEPLFHQIFLTNIKN